jgi:hypothetical protein
MRRAKPFGIFKTKQANNARVYEKKKVLWSEFSEWFLEDASDRTALELLRLF